MKLTELRIGSLVMSYHGVVAVTGINKADPWYLGITHTPNLIGATHGSTVSPIPLSEEWLLKFGFDWSSKASTHTGFGLIKRPYFLFSCYPNDSRCFIQGKLEVNNIKYVHQLQNLYFSITGEDLTYSAQTDKNNKAD